MLLQGLFGLFHSHICSHSQSYANSVSLLHSNYIFAEIWKNGDPSVRQYIIICVVWWAANSRKKLNQQSSDSFAYPQFADIFEKIQLKSVWFGWQKCNGNVRQTWLRWADDIARSVYSFIKFSAEQTSSTICNSIACLNSSAPALTAHGLTHIENRILCLSGKVAHGNNAFVSPFKNRFCFSSAKCHDNANISRFIVCGASCWRVKTI